MTLGEDGLIGRFPAKTWRAICKALAPQCKLFCCACCTGNGAEGQCSRAARTYPNDAALLSLSRCCRALRLFALPHLFWDIRLSSQRTISEIHCHLYAANRLDLGRPFRFTRYLTASVTPICFLDEQLALMSFHMPNLLELDLRLYASNREAVDLIDYTAAVRHLNSFLSQSGKAIRRLAVMFDDTPRSYRSGRAALVWEMVSWDSLPLSNSTTSLAFYTNSFVSDYAEGLEAWPLRILPPWSSVREFTTSLGDFTLMNPEMWRGQHQLRLVNVDSHGDAASSRPQATASAFCRALSMAAPAWRSGLTVLCLDGVPLDAQCALPLSTLSALVRLDLHAKQVNSSDVTSMGGGRAARALQSSALFLARFTGDNTNVHTLAPDPGCPLARGLMDILAVFLPDLAKLEVLHLSVHEDGDVIVEEILVDVCEANEEDNFILSVGRLSPSLRVLFLGRPEEGLTMRRHHVHIAGNCGCRYNNEGKAIIDAVCAVEVGRACCGRE